MGTVASGCHRGVGRVLGRNICSREHRGSKPGAGMNPHEYLQPSVICALSCFRQEPSKDPELPRGEGTSPFLLAFHKALQASTPAMRSEPRFPMPRAQGCRHRPVPLQAASAAPREMWGPQNLGVRPRAGAALGAHTRPNPFSFLLSPGAWIEAKQVQRAEPVLLRGTFGAGGSRGMGIPRARELFPTANGLGKMCQASAVPGIAGLADRRAKIGVFQDGMLFPAKRL